MGIVEKSSNAADVLSRSHMLTARIEMARQRLRIDVTKELLVRGVVPTEEAVSSIIDGLSPDVLAMELAQRT